MCRRLHRSSERLLAVCLLATAWTPTAVLPEELAEATGSSASSFFTADQQKALSESLRARVEFLSGRRVRLAYDFSTARELEDWYEYPRDAGRGEWGIKDGFLVGRGRLGLRHSWRFSREVTIRARYGGELSGRLHLFDSGAGRGAAETDFRAVYLESRGPPEMLDKKVHGEPEGPGDIAFGTTEGVLTLTAGRNVLYRGSLKRDEEGYCGIYCWGRRLRIDAVELEGEIASGWEERELSRLSAIARIESASGPETGGTPILPATGTSPWEWTGDSPLKRGRGGEYLLEAGADPFRVVIGSRSWSDYVIEGWVYLTPIGRISLEGRTNPGKLQSGHARVELATNKIVLHERDGERTGRKELGWSQAPADQVVPFRVEWLGQSLTVEVGGRQIARSSLRCPETGSVVVEGSGEGSQVGGLRIRLLRNNARRAKARSEPRQAVGREAHHTEAAHRDPGREPR